MKYNQPGDQPSNPSAAYIDGNPSAGIQGSIVPAASIEYPQREIVNLINDTAVVTPANTDLHQLGKAVQGGKLAYADDASITANQIAIALTPAPDSYYEGMTVKFKLANSITGATQIQVGSLGWKNLVQGGAARELPSNAYLVGDVLMATYDGTQFQIINPVPPGAPVYLQSSPDWYVNYATGNDSWDGQASARVGSTNRGPWKTLQRAANEIPKFNLNGYDINIHVADSPNYANVVCPGVNGSGQIHWIGNTTTPANVVISGSNVSAVKMVNVSGTYSFNGFKVFASGTSSTDPVALFSASGNQVVLILGVIEFAGAAGCHIALGQGALCSNLSAACQWTLSAGAVGNGMVSGSFAYLTSGALFQNNSAGGPDISISTSITFNGSFIDANYLSTSSFLYNSLTGGSSVTGKRYNVASNAIIGVAGGSGSYYPGNVSGTSATQGQYF